jgi:N-acetylneuraminate synthase
MNKFISINGRKIGKNFEPYIIAEMSANHNGDIKNAYKIIDMARECGADAVKIQTYRPDTITINHQSEEFICRGGLWDGKSLYELYELAHMPWEWHKLLFSYAKKKGITIFSSPFDFSAVDLLEDLNAPAYKIASFEIIDLPLIKYVAQTGKPMIISTGMANADEIQEAIETAEENGCNELAILHCVSGYPAPPEDYNLKTILDMKKKYNHIIGLSDHTIDNATAIASVALGASIIEKHVTLNRNDGGPDDSFSLEYNELKSLCLSSKSGWKSIGNVNYDRKNSEKGNIKFRRSLYFIQDMKAGDLITEENVRSIRPGYGILPKYKEILIGKRIKKNVSFGTKTSWDLIED